jgi:hypothetical protein
VSEQPHATGSRAASNHVARRREFLGWYVAGVRDVWEKEWRGKDHPYSRFSTFLGERLLTDFDLRHIEPRERESHVR